MKKMAIMAFLLFGAFTSKVQAQKSVNAAGGTATGSGGSVTFTIGQIDYTCNEAPTGTVSQGVQQLQEIAKILDVVDFTVNNIEMVVYPNPTADLVNLKIENYQLDSLSYALYDLQGRQLATNKIPQNETQIPMRNLPSAIYLLTVRDGNKLLKSFKIIKQN